MFSLQKTRSKGARNWFSLSRTGSGWRFRRGAAKIFEIQCCIDSLETPMWAILSKNNAASRRFFSVFSIREVNWNRIYRIFMAPVNWNLGTRNSLVIKWNYGSQKSSGKLKLGYAILIYRLSFGYHDINLCWCSRTTISIYRLMSVSQDFIFMMYIRVPDFNLRRFAYLP